MLPGTHTYNATTTLTKSGTMAAPIVISGAPGNRPLKVRDNPGGDYCAMSCSPQSGETTTAAQAKALPRNADGSLPPIQ